ncbi:MAG: hypothetical protein C5B59_08635 [Bacteroidetes bacterium]|nr:MAG: hypothetical protein C5B59_08635 [Bacteroidota bacterium]
MPNLTDSVRGSLPGYIPAPEKPPLPSVMPGKGIGNFGANPSIRCPLPPFNIGPDTLRQFDQSEGITPKRRVIPLPVQTTVGTGSVVTNTTTSTSSGSSSSSTTLTAKTVAYTSPILAAGGMDQQVLTLSKSFQLISMVANVPCEMRLYGSALSQAIDASRATDAPLAAELFNNLITNIVLDTSPFIWEWQNRVGVNTDNPQDTNIFITTINTGSTSAQILITITYLPLES